MKTKQPRRRARITQKEAVFYILYKRFRAGETSWLPVHQLIGEVWCDELGKWGYVSYECSARASDVRRENPGLLQREKLRGKSGATYYGYRINPAARAEMILNEDLYKFYRTVNRRMSERQLK